MTICSFGVLELYRAHPSLSNLDYGIHRFHKTRSHRTQSTNRKRAWKQIPFGRNYAIAQQSTQGYFLLLDTMFQFVNHLCGSINGAATMDHAPCENAL